MRQLETVQNTDDCDHKPNLNKSASFGAKMKTAPQNREGFCELRNRFSFVIQKPENRKCGTCLSQCYST